MRLRDDTLRDALAAEYALGTLGARARSRMQSLMRYDADLRRRVETWEQQLGPLSAGLPERHPPERVWKSIAARIRADRMRGRVDRDRGVRFWRAAALAMTLLVVVGTIVVANLLGERRPDMMAVLSDEKAEAALLIAWPLEQRERKHVRLRLIAPPKMPPDGALELWLIPADRMDRPISAGMVAMTPEQTLQIKPDAAAALSNAWGFAVSVEPKGGSPTGSPTGPMIFRGPCIKLINT